MNGDIDVENINCPYCDVSKSVPWVNENGFIAVKCTNCGLVYVNPRPIQNLIREAVETGIHTNVDHGRTVINRRVNAKVAHYKKILSSMFKNVWKSSGEISWLDVGAGYGELVEAVSDLAPKGSRIEGIEPMKPKADHAQQRGLVVRNIFLGDVKEKYNFISLVNVFSHISDFRNFLEVIKTVLTENGEFFIETGNIGDLISSHEVPGELDLPDHLVFAGEHHMKGYLSEAGFSIIDIKYERRDGFINFLKNIIKKIIGRHVSLSIPYTSLYRSVMIRAQLKSK